STLWRLAAGPHHSPDPFDAALFAQINSAIARGAISAAIPETVFTLDAIRDAAKRRLERERGSRSNDGVSGQPDGTMGLGLQSAPGTSSEAAGEAGAATDWDVARKLGFRVLH